MTLKRVPAHERKSISRNLFIFGPMLIGTFLLIWGWGIPRKSLWHRYWDTLYNKPTRCNSGSIVFINIYKYALHVSGVSCVHHQEHYKL